MKSVDAAGKVCKNSACGGVRLGLQYQTRTFPFKVGNETFQLQVKNVPVAQCPKCKHAVAGEDATEAEQNGFINAASEFWIGRLLKANGSAAEIIKLKMLFHRVAKSFKNPAEAAKLMGQWFSHREKFAANLLEAPPEPARKTG